MTKSMATTLGGTIAALSPGNGRRADAVNLSGVGRPFVPLKKRAPRDMREEWTLQAPNARIRGDDEITSPLGGIP